MPSALLTKIFLQSPEAVPVVPMGDEIEKGEQAISALKGLSFDDAIAKISSSLVDFAFKLCIAVLVFYIGRFVIRKLYELIHRTMLHRKVDASLTTFVLSLFKMLLYFILIVTVIGILGIETSSFLAIFASAGVAVGLALSGTLQNFAGGVLILLLKPYKVGDFIETQGYTGTVKEIQIFHTVINTVDNKAIIIPNGGLSTGTINNYSLESYRRVDWTVCLSYDTDYEKARQTILDILNSDDRVVKKYIEDDRLLRLETAQENSDSDCQPGDNCYKTEKKRSIWSRMFRHHKKLTNQIANSEIAPLPPKIEAERTDCSPFVGLGEMADSSINLTVRAWTQSKNYWGLFFEMNRRFFTELPKAGFSFPFPQMDVHIQTPEAEQTPAVKTL